MAVFVGLCVSAHVSTVQYSTTMTASRLLRPAGSGAQEELDNRRPYSPPPAKPIVCSTTTTARKRPRTSSTSSSPAPLSWASNYRSGLPPYPPSNSYQANDFVELELTRPQTQFRPHTSDARHTQLPHIRNNVDKSSHRSDDIERGNHFGVGGGGGDISLRRRGSDGWFEEKEKGTSEGTTKLSKAAKVMEEDRKKVASIRSFLLNFLEERDCSIKKRLVSSEVEHILHIGTCYCRSRGTHASRSTLHHCR